jgi:hypothetical protein
VTLWLRGKIKDFITDNFSLYSKYWKEFDKKIPSQHSLSELRIIPNNAMKNNEKEQKHSKHLSKAEGISSGREDELASGYHFFDYQYHNAKYWVDDARVKSSKAHFLSKCYQVIDRMITPAKQVVGGHNNFIESFLLLNEKYLADESSDNNCKENGFAAQFAMALHSINMCIKEKASQNNKRMKNDYDSVVQSMLDKAKYVDEEDKLCIAQKLANFFNYIKYLSCSDSKDSTFALEVCDLYNSMQPADQLVHNELTNFENQMLDISSLIL